MTLDEALRDLAQQISDGRRVLVALDFDGVLAPLQDDPATSRALPQAVRALAELGTADGVELALVSGRALADLASLAEVPDGTHLVGSHGSEHAVWRRSGLEPAALNLDPGAAALLDQLTTALSEAVQGSTARIERKPGSVVLHTRTASPPDAGRLTAAALDLANRDGVDAIRGKDVVELSVLHRTKADALADLRAELGVDALLYAGDDVTDERAFAALGPDDVTVRVGPGQTAARFRVADPFEMSAVLHRLLLLLTRNG